MGVIEVLEILKEYKKQDPNKWVTVNEIKEQLETQYKLGGGAKSRVYGNLNSLIITGQAKAQGQGIWHYKVLFKAV